MDRLGIVVVAERVVRSRLRWFGHVERKSDDDWVSKCRQVSVVRARRRGRGRKTWMECVEEDMHRLQLRSEDAWIVAFGGMAFWGTSNPCQRGNTDAEA